MNGCCASGKARTEFLWRLERRFSPFLAGMILLPLLILFPALAFSQENHDSENYPEECAKGVTIYCLAAGMEEQKSGNLEKALEYYRSACENHHTQGHLRACTPFLSLAKELGRLDEASSHLQSRCREGDDRVCFYLAKEFFKIAEYHRGFVHLERLCRENFQPPDPADYGPCYHLGINLEKLGDLKRARDIFKFDCDRDPASAKPSCDQHEVVVDKLALEESKKQLKPVEALPFIVVLVPLVGLLILQWGGPWALRALRLHAPLLTMSCWVAWEFHAQKELTLRSDLFFILPALLLTGAIAWLAHKRLKASIVKGT